MQWLRGRDLFASLTLKGCLSRCFDITYAIAPAEPLRGSTSYPITNKKVTLSDDFFNWLGRMRNLRTELHYMTCIPIPTQGLE